MTQENNNIDSETLESLHLVRQWLHEAHSGTLATLSRKPAIQGFPLGSIVPFCLDSIGRPIILIASIAAHTRNMMEDNRATLFISNPHAEGDPQSSWRASLVGRFKRLTTSDPASHEELITPEELKIIRAKYIDRVPRSVSYFGTHSFSFWRLSELLTVRYIAGFGRIKWLDGDQYLSAMSEYGFPEMEKGALQHMNDDHEHNLVEIVRAFTNVVPKKAEMISLNVDGFCVRTEEPSDVYSMSFDELITESSQYKSSIIKILSKARKSLKNQ